MKKDTSFQWQNLLDRRCPRPCPGTILTEGSKLYCDECGFEITRNYLIRILSDEAHPIRRFASPEHAKRINAILAAMHIAA